MPRAKCFVETLLVKLVLHKIAGRNPLHQSRPHAETLDLKVSGETESSSSSSSPSMFIIKPRVPTR